MRLLLAALAFLAVAGCAATSAQWSDGWFVRSVTLPVDGADQKAIVRWKAGLPRSGWEDARDRAADFSFWNRDLGATLYGDTTCGERYDDAPLTVLANHLFFGFVDLKTERHEEFDLGGRSALRKVATGTLDGQPVRIGATVVKKGPCIFDLVLVAPPDAFASAEPAWSAFVDGFDARIDR